MGLFTKSTPTIPDAAAPDWVASHPAWLRLEAQLQWYDRKSVSCQGWYKSLKAVQITLAILIPAMSFLPADCAKWATAIAGSAIALLETMQHMNQYSTLWVTYRSTAERLKHEKYLFLSAAGPYREVSEAERLVQLAERVEEHVSTEHANWFNETRRNVSDKQKEAA
jgi:hypothetical protein